MVLEGCLEADIVDVDTFEDVLDGDSCDHGSSLDWEYAFHECVRRPFAQVAELIVSYWAVSCQNHDVCFEVEKFDFMKGQRQERGL